ncbi:hypothetical protein EJ08DRAFT_692732 [Tothia fuscella]|uniref:C2H2-type domain-containing protein n=1 Tax=Tothia fuscella TaxID=1048955 RepID=A0A9P4U323_9PEZI|nr:hypothetical protein EJ08DRAFT_692732 [Tothia fuscella]
MVEQAINPESLVESNSRKSQPHYQDHQVSIQLRRTRPSPDINTTHSTSQRKTLTPFPSTRIPSINPESPGSQPSDSSKKRSAKMPSSDTSVQSSLTAPKYTKTGRVSKAQKGVQGAHRCVCGKVYSRAEHLRRHKQNHETQLPCPLSSCGKLFYRQDLLDRHLATKHNGSNNTVDANDSPSVSSGSSYGTHNVLLAPVVTSVEASSVAPSYIPGSSQHPTTSIAQTSNDSIRYQPIFYAQSITSNQFSSIPFLNFINPSTVKDTPSLKTETLSYRTPYSAPWEVELEATVESSHGYNIGGASDYSSSGDQSPFIPYQYLTSTPGELDTLYPPHNNFEPLWFPLQSTNASSPRSVAGHLPVWGEMEPTSFPASVASSPASTCAAMPPVIMPQGQNGVPYPLPWMAQRDRYGTLDLEGLLEDQHLGVCLSLRTKQHYVDAYWKNFHPLFPVLHKQSYRSQNPSPLLGAAVMAIGAQYTDEQFAKGDSRILHEKCLELINKYKQTLSSSKRLDYMQAIFLVELFSHFKAKRAAPALSDIFIETYDQLWQKHHNTPRARYDQLSAVAPHASDESLQPQWAQWIHLHAFERLLAACYILESQQALLLVRANQTPAGLGLELFMPAQIAVWEATSCSRWSQLMRTNSPPVKNIEQILDTVVNSSTQTPPFEPFQCSLLTACHSASVVARKQDLEQAPYIPAHASHQIFEIENTVALQSVLCLHPNIRIMHHAVVLASVTPLRALLASSGESWVLSQRLSHEALLAAAEFATLKNELHTWTDGLQPPAFFWTGLTAVNPSLQALQEALNISELALDTDAKNLAFGAEMALYYASLVLWAATFAAVAKAEANGLKFETDDTAEFEAPRAEHDARYFVQLAKADINSLVGDGFPSLERVDRWRFGVGAALRWSAWCIGGAGMRSSGVGELMEGAVGVLERLGRSGWVGDWF